ncbi:MAG: T9SS type A sorting domain-containing protein [Bacteroidia bacterium]|nr:T9SS type A sorting domain-containing protein [Bacteroidia bacterium]
MNKKLHFICLALFGSIFLKAQLKNNQSSCGTDMPSQQWEAWLSEQVEKYKEAHKNSQSKLVNYTIPVIVHIVHTGETVGTFPNIDSNQVKSQIQVMNDDFNASGLNIGNTPSSFTGAIASTGIHFCRAKFNPVGTGLPELGIDRVNVTSNNWTNPTTPTLNLQAYFNSVIIPSTIWDPTKYLNIWVSDRPVGSSIRGFATYPSGTSLNGVFGGSMGTATNDGIWIWGKAFGTTGTIQSPYDKGRTTVHELGHWLGLRHIWGDGNCLSDYCGDTPTAKAAHYGCVTSTPIDQCGVNQSPFGEMPFNFMDMTDDACKYMFTYDQNLRMQAAMSQCVNRNSLGTHGLCEYVPASATSGSAVASFALNSGQCLGSPFTPYNTSIGYPNPTFVWSSAPAASFSPATTVANPAITLNNAGTYTITLVATNSLSSSTYSMLVTATGSCAPFMPCLDSLKQIRTADTLRSYKAASSSFSIGCPTGFKGYMVGTNCYKDKEFAQFFPPSSYGSTAFPQVNSVIVLFDSMGTKAINPSTQIKCKIYGGNGTVGPGAVIGTKNDSLGKIVSSPKVTSLGYLGKANVAPLATNTLVVTKIIPFRFDFPSPVIINNASGFFAGIEAPLPNTGDSINIMANTYYNTSADSSSWYFQNTNAWKNYRYGRGLKIQLAIMPLISCSPIADINKYRNSLDPNVNVMPNPNNGVFSIVFTLPAQKEIEMEIFNALGQKISSDKLHNISNNVVDLDLRDKPSGIYYVRINNGTENVMKKIIISN